MTGGVAPDMRRPIITLALLAAGLLPATAVAATPETGSVSAESPKVQWTGSLQNPYLLHNLFNYEGTTAGAAGTLPCEAPMCDTFTLDVATGGVDLTLDLTSEQSPDISLRVQDPSGAWTYYDGWSDGAPATKVRIKKAAKGTYVINVVARVFGSTNPTAVQDQADYAGIATLMVPPPAAAPAPAVTPPAPAPAPAQPAPAKKPSAKAACQKKAKKIKNKRKRKAALKRCAKKR